MVQKLEKAIRLVLALNESADTIASGEIVCLKPDTRKQLLQALGEDPEQALNELIEELNEEDAVPQYIPPESYYRPVRPLPRAHTERGLGSRPLTPALDWDDEDTQVDADPFCEADTFVAPAPYDVRLS